MSIHLSNAKRLLPSILPVSSLGYLQNNRTYSLSRHTTLDFGFELSSKAEKAEFEIDGMRHTRTFPWVSTRFPGPSYRMLTNQPWEVLYLCYHPEQRAFFEAHGVDISNPGWEFVMTPRIASLISEIRLQMETFITAGAADRIDLLCMELIFESLLSHRLMQNQYSEERGRIERIASYLRLHACEITSLDMVLERYHLSRRTFFRHWKKYFDIAPNVYLMQSRLEQVCGLLTDTDLRLYEIAERTGFPDSSYLCAAFRREKGMSALEYRRKCRGRFL